MATVNVGDVVQITARLRYGGVDAIENIFYVRHEGTAAVDAATFITQAGLYMESCYTTLQLDLSDDVQYEDITYYNVTQDYPMGQEEWPSLTAGTATVDATATQVAFQVNFTTQIKRTQGRKYIGVLTEASVNAGGIVAPTTVTALKNFALAVLSNFSVGAESFEVGHVKASTGAWIPWIGYSVPLLVATQRRRKQGVGA